MKAHTKTVPTDELISEAELLNDAGEYEAALALAKRAARRKLTDIDQIKRLAVIFQVQRKQIPAVKLLYKALELDSSDFTTHEELLRILLDTNRLEEVVNTCNKLLSIFPKHVVAKDVLGIAYMQMGQIDKALRVTEELILIDPMDSNHHFKKGVLLQQKGEMASAMTSFLRVVDIEPDTNVADEATDAIELLDRYQIKQILSIATNDSIFRAKLMLDPVSASRERGFVLSRTGISILAQIDIDSIPRDDRITYYN